MVARFAHFSLLSSVCLASHLIFEPDQAVDYNTPELPVQYNLTDSQIAYAPVDSYWATSFILASNNEQYAVVSNALLSQTGQTTFRSSILDINNPANYWMNVQTLPMLNRTKETNGRLDLNLKEFRFEGLSNDSISRMRTWGSTDNFGYNIILKASTPALYNAGTGFFSWGSGNTSQWSLPSCETSGTITINGTVLNIDTNNSVTWYDRQHGFGGPVGNFTWFGVQFPGSSIKASIWASDSAEPFYQRLRFATVHTDHGLEIVRLDFNPDYTNNWVSTNTNITYAQKWTLSFQNGDYLDIESVRGEQEIYGRDQDVAYSGFVKVTGQFFGQKEGYGMVDIVQ